MSWQILLPALALSSFLLTGISSVAAGEKPVDAKELAQKRINAARSAYEFVWNEFKPFDLSKGDGEKVYAWSRRWMESERDAAATKADQVAAVEGHFERMKMLEKEVADYHRGTIPFQQLVATRFYRAEAETWLAEAKAK